MLSKKTPFRYGRAVAAPRKGVFFMRRADVSRHPASGRAGRAEKAEPAWRAERGAFFLPHRHARVPAGCGIHAPVPRGMVLCREHGAPPQSAGRRSKVRYGTAHGEAVQAGGLSCIRPGLFRERLTPEARSRGGLRHCAGRHFPGRKYASAARGVLRGRKASPETEGFAGISMLFRGSAGPAASGRTCRKDKKKCLTERERFPYFLEIE